jgi:hypothetical protein
MTATRRAMLRSTRRTAPNPDLAADLVARTPWHPVDHRVALPGGSPVERRHHWPTVHDFAICQSKQNDALEVAAVKAPKVARSWMVR